MRSAGVENYSNSSRKGVVTGPYIFMVQHLIERCLLFYMDRDECIQALSKHVFIEPVVTLTVWNELEKTNKEFFEDYLRNRLEKRAEGLAQIVVEATTKLRLQRLNDDIELKRRRGRSCLQLRMRTARRE